MKLISMVAFTLMPVLEKYSRDIVIKHLEEDGSIEGIKKFTTTEYNTNVEYAKLLNTKLKVGMLIPCNEEGKPLTEPKNFKNWKLGMVLTDDLNSTIWYDECKDYKEALDKVLFSNTYLLKVNQYQNTQAIAVGDSKNPSVHPLCISWYQNSYKKWIYNKGVNTLEHLINSGVELNLNTMLKLGII